MTFQFLVGGETPGSFGVAQLVVGSSDVILLRLEHIGHGKCADSKQ